MTEQSGRDWVRQRVETELSNRGWNIADLAREAGTDPGTVGDFLGGSRWPQYATRSRIATALGWTPDSIALIERGAEPMPGTVGTSTQDAGVLLDMPPEALEGLGPAEREEVITAAKLSALEKAREIRRRQGE